VKCFHKNSSFNGVIASDITDKNSGAVKVNDKLGPSYQGLLLGSRTATTIFMYSHSGGSIKGATVPEVKRSATTTDNIPAVIDSAFDELEKELFFLQKFGDRYFFSNQPNLNKILVTQMDNVKDQELEILEKELLQEKIKGNSFKVYLWEDKSANIVDDENLKLVILQKDNKQIISDILKKKGNTPRTKSNTLFCLFPSEMDRGNFTHQMKKKIAYELIIKAPNLNLSPDQRKEIKKELDKLDANLFESLRKYYRMVAIPNKDEFKIIDLGVPTYGDTKSLFFKYLVFNTTGATLSRISSSFTSLSYTSSINDFVSTAAIYQSTLSTPGEFRLSKRTVLENSIVQGVQLGLFGLGIITDDKPICNHFKQSAMVYFDSSEILIKDSICIEQKKKPETESSTQPTTGPQETPTGEKDKPTEPPKQLALEQLSLNFILPKGKVSSLMGILTYLQTKYENLEFDISASNGKLTKQEYEDKIEEALRQIGIILKEKE